MTYLRRPSVFVCLIVFAIGCASNSENPGAYTETGLASWYGKQYQGNRTASGERFNRKAFTAAHKTLPFGTIVEVKHLKSGEKVRVRVNDRGPFVAGRIIDLSQAAAAKLDIVNDGVAKVRIEVVEWGRG